MSDKRTPSKEDYLVLVVFCILKLFHLSQCNDHETEKLTNGLQRYPRSQPDIHQYFKQLNSGIAQDRRFPKAKATPYMTFSSHKIRIDGKHMIKLTCSATSFLSRKTKMFQGILIKHKRLGATSYKNLVAVTKFGNIVWNGKFRWTETVIDQPLASAKPVNPSLGYGRLDLIVPEDKCLSEAGVYYCQIIASAKSGVTSRYESSYNLRRSQIKSCKYKNRDKTIVKKNPSKTDEDNPKSSLLKTQNFIIAGIVVVSLLIVVVSGIVVWNFTISNKVPDQKKKVGPSRSTIEAISREAKEHVLAQIRGEMPVELLSQIASRRSQIGSQEDDVRGSSKMSLQKRSVDRIGSGNIRGSQVLISQGIDGSTHSATGGSRHSATGGSRHSATGGSRHSETGFRPSQSMIDHQPESQSRVDSTRLIGQSSGQMQGSVGNLEGIERQTQSNYEGPSLSQQRISQSQISGMYIDQRDSAVPVSETRLAQQRSSQGRISGLQLSQLSQQGTSVPLNEVPLSQQRSSQGRLSELQLYQHGSSVPLDAVELHRQRSLQGSQGRLSELQLNQHGSSVPLDAVELHRQRSLQGSQGRLSELQLNQHGSSVPLDAVELNRQRSLQGKLSGALLSQHGGYVPVNEPHLNQQISQDQLNGLQLGQHGSSAPLNETQPGQYRRSVDHIVEPRLSQHNGSQHVQQTYSVENRPQSISQLRSSYIMNQNQRNSRDQFSPTTERDVMNVNNDVVRHDSKTLSQTGFTPAQMSAKDASQQDPSMTNTSSLTTKPE